jgi:hypothetical protein
MSASVLERAWEIYKYMHPDAPQKRKEQLREFIQTSPETSQEKMLPLGLAHLMKLDLQER